MNSWHAFLLHLVEIFDFGGESGATVVHQEQIGSIPLSRTAPCLLTASQIIHYEMSNLSCPLLAVALNHTPQMPAYGLESTES